jgi:hypothetical protein
VKAVGISHYPVANSGEDPQRLAFRAVQEDSVYGDLVKGYVLLDEPDQLTPYAPPTLLRTWATEMRRVDSTRPLYVTMGRVIGINQTFYHQPQGSSMDDANAAWREFASIPDILAGDMYTNNSVSDPNGVWGPWTYATFTRRLRSLNEGKTPVWCIVETTSQAPSEPVPSNVVKACWSAIIAGADAIVFFDHRFSSSIVSGDFAHMLHNPPMKAAVSAFCTRATSLGDALNCPEANLVTAVTSSNVSAGPYGGTYGVPMHFTTRDDGTHQYLFAMGIRPGTTTATFTIPAWAGETITVLDESRTVTVDGAGVLTDTFPADYTVHLYQL